MLKNRCVTYVPERAVTYVSGLYTREGSQKFTGFRGPIWAAKPRTPTARSSPWKNATDFAKVIGAGGWRSVQGFHKTLDFVKAVSFSAFSGRSGAQILV